MAASFYWHDYETWGSDPSRDRPCQFAGLRTDSALNEVGEPTTLFCKPSDDLLPHPDACLVTGITPQQAYALGRPEAELARIVQRELSQPETCTVGYNNLRFDDEVTRWLFYRNLLDPYAHAWQNGNSRWDLIDVLRLAHALRPEGIHWPEREAGTPSFKLEALTAANGIDHSGAHDALADVRATLAMARRLKHAQPRLFDYALGLRDHRRVRELLDSAQPLLHVSQRYPAAQGCIAPVLAVAAHPGNAKGVLCFDLRHDPSQLLDLSVEELRMRLFTRTAELPDGVERLPLKGLKTNASPMLAPMKTLTPEAGARWSIDPDQVAEHARRALSLRQAIEDRLRDVYAKPDEREQRHDPDYMLYSGGFFTDADRREMARLSALSGQELAGEQPRFEDERLPTLLFRMRARSWPETLDEDEREDWDAWRFERLTDPDGGATLTIDAFAETIAERRGELEASSSPDAASIAVLEALAQWGEQVMDAA